MTRTQELAEPLAHEAPNPDAYEPLPEAQDPPPAPLIAQLRARHAALLAERARAVAEAETRDYGYAVVLGELERWIATIEQRPPEEQ